MPVQMIMPGFLGFNSLKGERIELGGAVPAQFEKEIEPDYVGVLPDELPYE